MAEHPALDPVAVQVATWAPFHGLRVRATRAGEGRYALEFFRSRDDEGHPAVWETITIGFPGGAGGSDADQRTGDAAELAAARQEVGELRALFDLQSTRMQRATALWRAEEPAERALMTPDLGRLLDWLIARGDREVGNG
jgi:hypothetical protein